MRTQGLSKISSFFVDVVSQRNQESVSPRFNCVTSVVLKPCAIYSKLLGRCYKCELQVDCEYMKFTAGGCLTGKYLTLDQFIKSYL